MQLQSRNSGLKGRRFKIRKELTKNITLAIDIKVLIIVVTLIIVRKGVRVSIIIIVTVLIITAVKRIGRTAITWIITEIVKEWT